jgi:uncharacterized peroxidase-related enzyme
MKHDVFQTTLKPVAGAEADERSKAILQEAVKKNGMLPNMYANMINSPGLLETYLHGYEVFRKESGFTPQEQEIVFLTISYENGCDYCMAAHSFIADKMSQLPETVTNAIREGEPVRDEKLAVLSAFTKELFVTRGRPSQKAAEKFVKAGYSERQVLEIILALAVKTLSNYTNHVFDTKVDDMFAGRLWHKEAVQPVG